MSENQEKSEEIPENILETVLGKDTYNTPKICPICHSKNFFRDGHCEFCWDCGWSLCQL